MQRRNFIVLATPFLLNACVSTQMSPVANANQRRKTLQASLIVGAALGAVVAKQRGGSLLAGAAIGAFAGGVVSSSLQYARLLLKSANGDLETGYDILGSSAAEDQQIFFRENVPLALQKQALTQKLAENRRDTNPNDLLDSLGKVKSLQEERTVPTEIYAQCIPVYQGASSILPGEAGVQSLLPPQLISQADANSSVGQLGQVVGKTQSIERKTDQTLAKLGMSWAVVK